MGGHRRIAVPIRVIVMFRYLLHLFRWVVRVRLRRLALVSGCATAVFVLAAVAPSLCSAHQARLLSGSFGAVASNPSDLYPLSEEENSVVVDQSSHDVYVSDPRNYRVEKFDSSGHFLLMFGRDVNRTAVEEARVEAERDLCPAPSHPADVCQAGVSSPQAGGFEPGRENRLQLAVDSSTGPSAGDVYVGESGSARDDQQDVFISNATGGTFKLSFEGQSTGALAHDAPAKESEGPGSLESALEGLATIGSGNVTVTQKTGVLAGTIGYTVIFKGALAASSLPNLTSDGSGLSAGAEINIFNTPGVPGAFPNVSKFDSSGRLVASWGNNGEGDEKNGPPNGQLNGANATGSPKGPFIGGIAGLSVDLSGNLWVLDRRNGSINGLFEFGQDGGFLAVSPLGAEASSGIVVDGEDNVYVGEENTVVKYNSLATPIGQVFPSRVEIEQKSNVHPSALAIDLSAKELYVGAGEGVKRYSSSCHPVVSPLNPQPGCTPVEVFGAAQLGGGGVGGLSVDSSSHTVYASSGGQVFAFSIVTVPDVVTLRASGFSAGSAVLNGTVNPSGVELKPGIEGCRFEWGETVGFYEHSAPCEESAVQIGAGVAPVEVHAVINGLQAGHVYHFRLAAANHDDVNELIDEPEFGQDFAFGPPVIERALTNAVTASGAVVEATVNPDDVDTRVWIEYGSETGVYTQSTPAVDLGSGGSGEAASFHLQDLGVGVTYHYRAVAENVLGAAQGEDRSFTTQSPGAFSLLDGRGWELVSPPDKNGALIETVFEVGVIEASPSGDAVSYFATRPLTSQAQGNSNSPQVLSVHGVTGWETGDLASPHEVASGTSLAIGPEVEFFSEDLSRSIVQPLGFFTASLSPAASAPTPFLRSDFSGGDTASFCTVSCYRPMVSGCPPEGEACSPSVQAVADVPAGTVFGGEFGGATQCKDFCGPIFYGATPDATHVILGAEAALIEGAPAKSLKSQSLYEWNANASAAEALQLVSVLPNHSPVPESAEPVLGAPKDGKGGLRAKAGAIAADGSRVIFSEERGSRHLYLRDMADEQTLQLGNGAAVFQAASADASVVFFTEGGHLYRCAVIEEEGQIKCDLSDLSPQGGVVGGVLGSKDGSSVYFVSNEALAHNVVENGAGPEEAIAKGNCAEPDQAQPAGAVCNLYEDRDGQTLFIARLSGADSPDWTEEPKAGVARVSPNGEWLTFMSSRPLSGYDNRDVVTGEPDEEVYLYHAATGRLICASCDRTGASPRGLRFEYQGNPPIASHDLLFHVPVAASVPGWTVSHTTVGSLYQPRFLSNEGRLFFDSPDALVPQDTNGLMDVYEYEPLSGGGAPSQDSCTERTSTYVHQDEGCVGLISSGQSNEESAFFDASENGDDVFFITTAQLSFRDTDTTYDVYDARVGGGEAEPAKPVECQGDACQSFVEPPNDQTPGSLTFSGLGNIQPAISAPVDRHSVRCARGRRLAKGRCVTAKSKRGKRARKTKRSGHERRVGG
jgi:hypothetical protein